MRSVLWKPSCLVQSLVFAGLLVGCSDSEPGFVLPAPDMALFVSQVQPVLARDCAFHVCHGARERFFQVLGPGRPRLDPALTHLDPITAEEIQFNYDRARSMIDPADIEGSLLLRKPLSQGAGGDGHLGTDGFGRDVYESINDPSYQVLLQWAKTGQVGGLPVQPQAGMVGVAGAQAGVGGAAAGSGGGQL